MLQDTDLFERLNDLSSVGDVLASVNVAESPSPDERYDVLVEWRFRGALVGSGQYVIEPVLETDKYQIFWVGLQFADDWQGKGLYTEIVKSYAQHLLSYGIVGVSTIPWNKEAEARLASQGFEWTGRQFYLDFAKAL